MHFFLEDFVKGRKKINNPKTEHTGYDPLIPPNKVECKDHKGNVFTSYKEMCKFYRVSYRRFLERKNILKLPIEMCLIRKKFKRGKNAKSNVQGQNIQISTTSM